MLIALVGLWIAYLVPQRLRHRQQLLESRADDRFSEHLRVLRVAAAPPGVPVLRAARALPAAPVRPALPAGSGAVAAGQGTPTTSARVHLHPGRPALTARRRGGAAMERPHGTRDRVAADAARRSAAEHAARARQLARRRAGARRRALLTIALLAAAVAGWVAVPAAGASLLLAAVPTAGLAGVLLLGRRAVVAARRADAAWAAGAADRLPAPVVVGRAVRPSDATTQVLPRVRDSAPLVPRVATRAESQAAEHDARAAGEVRTAEPVPAEAPDAGSPWAPVPVPRPTYTLKPAARRPEPAPLEADGAAAAGAAPAAAGAPAPEAAPETPAEVPGEARPAPAATTAGLDLDAILARRRASGE